MSSRISSSWTGRQPASPRRIRRDLIAALVLAAIGSVSSEPAAALTLLDPNLVVTTFSTAPTYSVAIPGPAATRYDAFLYSLSRSQTTASRIDELARFDANGVELSRGTIPLDGAVLQMGSGAYSDRLFASEFGVPTGFQDGLYEIGSDLSITLFSNLGGGNPDSHGIAFGAGGSFGDSVFVANPTAGTNDARANSAIARLTSDGAIQGTLATDPDGPFYLAFPSAAGYGDYLYFTLLSSNRLMRVDAAGRVELFAQFETGETAFDLAFGVGGALGDALYATVNNPGGFANRRLVRILPNGTVETVGMGLRGFRFDIDPASGDLFLADEAGGILRISAIPEPGVALLLGAGLMILSGTRRPEGAALGV